MTRTYTQRAFLCLMIPIAHIIAFAVFVLLATATELPAGHDGIFGAISISLMLTFPLVQLGSGIRSVVNQVRALRNQESKVKNGIMMAVSILYFIAVVLYCFQFWTGMMSV